MNRHLSGEEIEAYRTRSTSPEKFLEMNDHICSCDQCSRHFESPEKVRKAYDAILKELRVETTHWPEHMAYEQLAGFVDDTLDQTDREAVSAHIEDCTECSSDIKEMRALKARIETEAAGSSKSPKWGTVAALFKTLKYRPAFVLVCFMAAFALFIGVQQFLTQFRLARLEKAFSRLEQENNQLRRKTESIPKAPGRTMLAMKDGSHQIAIDDKGELFGLAGLPASYEAALKDALTNGRIVLPPSPKTGTGSIGYPAGRRSQS